MKDQKIEAPDGNAAGRDVNAPAAPVVNIQSVSGTSIIGNQGDVHVQVTTQRKSAPRVVIQPGPEHISEEQKVALQALRDEWMALHASIKKKPLSHGSAWKKINAAADVTSYHLIKKERFADAVACVKQEMAKLRSMRSAPSKDADWHASRIRGIKARCRNQLGDPEAYKAYIKKNFGASSLTDLATDELQRTYTYIMGKKRKPD